MKLFVGVNFDLQLLERFNDLNQRHSPDIVKEVYGSVKGDSLGGVREDSRLEEVSYFELEKFCKRASEFEIDVCYAINSPIITSEMCGVNDAEYSGDLKMLQAIGIKNLIVASPAFAEYVQYYFPNFGLIGSTVMEIDSINKIIAHEHLFSRICPSTNRNRDPKFFDQAMPRIELELLVNELCLFRCPWRSYHYVQESMNKYFRSSMKFISLDQYPIDKCWKEFIHRSHEILKSRWIRPEDIKFYERAGISWFKISGRTKSSQWILSTTEAYLNRRYRGNLLDLFPAIPGSLQKEKQGQSAFNVKNSKLERYNLLHKFFITDCFLGCHSIQCDFFLKTWNKMVREGDVEILL